MVVNTSECEKKADRFLYKLLVICIVLGQYAAYSGTVHTDCSAPNRKSNQTTNSIQIFVCDKQEFQRT